MSKDRLPKYESHPIQVDQDMTLKANEQTEDVSVFSEQKYTTKFVDVRVHDTVDAKEIIIEERENTEKQHE